MEGAEECVAVEEASGASEVAMFAESVAAERGHYFSVIYARPIEVLMPSTVRLAPIATLSSSSAA